MRSALWIRVAGVVLALFAAGFVSFPSFPSSGIFTSTPAPLINRALKGDRLPSVSPAVWPHELGSPVMPLHPQRHEKIPVGCDATFSPISAPRLADVFGRCMA